MRSVRRASGFVQVPFVESGRQDCTNLVHLPVGHIVMTPRRIAMCDERNLTHVHLKYGAPRTQAATRKDASHVRSLKPERMFFLARIARNTW